MILNRVNGQLNAPAALPLWVYSRYRLSTRLSGLQHRHRRFGEDENFLNLPVIELKFLSRPCRIDYDILAPTLDINNLFKKTAW